jgi:undecaprenyl diphosphate synthase
MSNEAAKLHLAVIPDGNRRWARKQGLLAWNGHEKAIENFRSIVDWCRKHPDIATLTVWCFSTENWKRDPEEVQKLMEIYEKYLREERKGFVKEKTRFLHSGRLDRIPASLSSLIKEVQRETADQKEFTLNLAVDYGGKDEILRAISKLKNSTNVTEEDLRECLDHPELPDIDLIIRTSGEHRTSNFFLWQSTYAEWIFIDTLFPEFSVQDLADALREFSDRKRRFGS